METTIKYQTKHLFLIKMINIDASLTWSVVHQCDKKIKQQEHNFMSVPLYYKQELVKKMETTKNTVEATNQPNLYEKLESLQENLVLCEKALAEYLETKRLAFNLATLSNSLVKRETYKYKYNQKIK
jgi:hypothetical protein